MQNTNTEKTRNGNTDTNSNKSPAKAGDVGSYVNEGVEAFTRTTSIRVDMFSPTLCFQPREYI